MPGLLPAALLAFPLLVPTVDGVPRLPIEATCRAIARVDPAGDADVCLRLEGAALADPPTRDRCTRGATLGGFASYVELITCLEVATGRFKRPDGAPAAAAPEKAPRREREPLPPAQPKGRRD
jgi:hypothetical protein